MPRSLQEALGDELRSSDLEATPPRLKVLQIVRDWKPRYLSADAVHSTLPECSSEFGLHATLRRGAGLFSAAIDLPQWRHELAGYSDSVVSERKTRRRCRDATRMNRGAQSDTQPAKLSQPATCRSLGVFGLSPLSSQSRCPRRLEFVPRPPAQGW